MSRSRILTIVSLLAACLALGACSKSEPTAAEGPKRTPTVEIVAAEGKGFPVGALMAANPVYVFFDAQCPHCAHLWEASIPLQKKVKFIWMPVGLINAASSSQGAALLGAADPAQTMAEHEASMAAGKGGISASASAPAAMEAAIKANTRLFNNLGIEGVPFIVARNARSGTTVTRSGALDTAALAQLIGVDPP